MNELKWHSFRYHVAGNRQKLPKEKRYVLVQLVNTTYGMPNPIVVGYLKYRNGEKSNPYFVTPGANITTLNTDDRVIYWCDCLPENFKYPNP